MANYPGALSTNANLYIAVNGLQTTLAVACTNTDTTLTLTSTTGFPTTGLVTIDNTEVVSYTGISGANLTGCVRGADGTTAASHPVGVTVGLTVVAAHHNLLKDEIIAIETALGTSLSNVFPATPTTGTGNVVLQTSPTLITPNLGTPSAVNLANATNLPNSATTGTANATANTLMLRDANANVKINTIVENFSTTVTAAGTTNLTAASSPLQQFTGTTTQNVVLPDATTLSVGYQISVLNRSTGSVTVKNNGGTALVTITANAQTTFTATSIGTANGVWDASTSSGGSAVVQYVRYIVGTATGSYSGSTTVFDVPFAYTQDGKSMQVFYNGQMLSASNYTETSSTQITMSTALLAGQEVVFRTINSGSNATAVTYLRENYIVGTPSGSYTGSLTVFNLTSTYTPGGNNLNAYLDGDLQTLGAGIDYLETNSSTVTFNNSLVAGQKVSFLFAQSAAPAGTVSNGTANQVAVYAATGVVVSGSDALNVGTNGNGIIKGTTTNDAAAAGKVGEVISASRLRSSELSLTSATTSNLASMTLTAGHWNIQGIVGTDASSPGGPVFSIIGSGISIVSATMPAADTLAVPSTSGEVRTIMNFNAGTIQPNGDVVFGSLYSQVYLSASTTFYLVVRNTFTGSTAFGYGSMIATRVR